MQRSSISERNTSGILHGSHDHTTEQLYGASSTSNRVYPDLEVLSRGSHAGDQGSADGVRVDAPTANARVGLQGQYQCIENMRQSSSTPTSSLAQDVSTISQQGLPSYRQVSMSEEGSHPSADSEAEAYNLESSLPDILHSHVVQQYPSPRPNVHRQQRNRSRRTENGDSSGNRANSGRSGRHGVPSRTNSTNSAATQENSCKEPCVKCVITVTSFRWVLVVLSVLGVSCVVAGIVLAALHPAVGTSLLYLSVMFIGLGVLLVIVVGVGWKCTPRDHEPLHALFGIGSFRHRRAREGRHRYRNRDRNWFGGMLYPEFQYRRPPPSYTASMQDYQNQVSHEQEENPNQRHAAPNDGESLPSSPPPSYRSRTSTAHSGIHIAFPHSMSGDYPSSRPPTYRSRAPSRRPSLPHDDSGSQTVLESDAEVRALQDVSFVESSNVYTSPDGAQTSRPSAPSLSRQHSSGPTLKEIPSTIYSPPKQATSFTISQVYTVPLRSSSRNYVHNPSIPVLNTHNFNSDLSLSTSSQNRHQNVTSESQNSQRPPSLHQRMASEDRHILEQTLQSLEEHMNESTGITNQGANLDEQDQTRDNVNTHL